METKTLNANATDAAIVCENSRAAEVHGRLVRLSRHEVTFELHSAAETIQLSEVLGNFRIFIHDQPIYTGRAVVSSVIDGGPIIICQANLQDSWLEKDVLGLAKTPGEVASAFEDLIQGWQRVYKISPESKVIVADIQSFLFELRYWAEELELGLSSAGQGPSRISAERKVVEEMLKPVVPCLNHLFQTYERVSARVPKELQPAHSTYSKRQLHPLLLCSPFMHRIFRKPLGYAGDYEMVGMILRDPNEGTSLFAKALNAWFLGQVPAAAHRNRVELLTQHFMREAMRAKQEGRGLRVFNLGCGPAREVLNFMARSDLSDLAELTLLDFNEETLAFANRTLEATRRAHGRKTRIQLVKKSVTQVIKAGMRNPSADYDFVYCAGLFDYLADRLCQQLMNLFYNMLAPGGLLLATNVNSSNPIRGIMGYIFEWWLIERNAAQMRTLSPRDASSDDCTVFAEDTGCNLFLEVRKPKARP